MNIKELKELIDLFRGSDITELELEKAGVRVRLKKGKTGSMPVVEVEKVQKKEEPTVEVTAPTEPEEAKGLFTVTSPIVGTFYRGPSPEAAPYVEIGDIVKKGQILCIIEAMKLMNEIESEVNGKVAEILVENGSHVEYGEPLFKVEPLPE